MAASPNWKVFRPNPTGKGLEYVASTKYAEDAARLVHDGWIVKYQHRRVVWQEGKEECSASESCDRATEIMHNRTKSNKH